MAIIKSAVDVVKDVGPTIWKYVKYQFCPNDYAHEFATMQKKLERQLEDVEAKLKTQLNQPGKKAGNQVDNWREEARKETAIKVEDLICKGGCFTYIFSSRKLDKKTQALNGVFMQGEKYTNAGESLVIDDHSTEYCMTVFKEKQEQLKLRQKDIEEKLETQCNQLGKIARKEVEDWMEKAGQQIAMKVEDLISQEECFPSSNLGKKTEELKQTFEQGEKYTNAGESLVIDDHSTQYCMTVFKENQEQLKLRQKDIEAKLETQRIQPGKIARKEVEDWMEKAGQQIAMKVEDLISQEECFPSSNLGKKTEELKQTFEQGEKYTNAGESLVIDDHSTEYCMTVFKENQEQLKLRQKDIEAKLETQRIQPGKIARKEVEDWMEKAGQQIAMKVEDLINQEECFPSSNLGKKTEELKETFEQGEKYTNAGESLVIDDHSTEYCMTVFKENQEQLKLRQKDIEAKLETQRIQPGKIARKEVEDWMEKAGQQIAMKVEDLINQEECSPSSNLGKKTEELKQTFEQGEKYTNAGENLVIDDHSIEYCMTVIKEKQEQLKLRQKDIEEKLETQRMQPGTIARKEVEDWMDKASQQIAIKVEDLISPEECSLSSNLEKKIEELKQTFEQGEKYTNTGESLVIDDHSIEYCAYIYKEIQEKIRHQKEHIEANLKAQCMQPRKIGRKEVEKWLGKAGQEIAIKVEDLISKGECSSSTNLRKNTEELKQILEEGKEFTNAGVSLVIDNHSIKGVPLLVEKCSGRDDIQDQILEWLMGEKVTKIAVWGMGGVGKTTIMKQVHNQLLKEPKLNKVVWVKVSKDFDIIVQQNKEFDVLKFQRRIASGLELKLEPEDHVNETKLAGLISQKLGQGSFVLILDDVWEPFSLEDVGIPNLIGNNGCKLVLTTRFHNVARAMDCKVIPMNPLPPNESLALFLEKVGSAVLLDGRIKSDIEPFLKQILQKCDGVPLAIVTVAKTMRGKLDPRSWKWALSKLSKFEGIVNRLKFSYECLESQCQECFLYCALYPEDYEIPKEELIECWIEEGFIYKEGETRDKMNCEGHVMLEKLVDNCLLESVKNRYKEDCVSMHDLFREMALDSRPQFLVKAGMALQKLPDELEWREDLLKVSLMNNYIKEIPSTMPSPKCPMLTTLLLSHNKISTIPEALFEHMLGLEILDLSNNLELSRLPSSISKLEKLTTLLLGGCKSLREVPYLSNLRGLKKLDLWRTSIEELPQGLNMLTNLKYFRLDDVIFSKIPKERSSVEIPDVQLQNLSKLQYLRVDARIPLKAEEIGRLGKLEFLQVRFPRVNDMSFFFNSRGKFPNIYNLFVGSYSEKFSGFLGGVELKYIMCYDIDICGEPNWLPSDVQRLKIRSCKDVRSLNDIHGFQDATDLRFVDIGDCDGMEFVLSLSLLSRCNLEELGLYGLDNLNAVFGEVGAVAKSAPLSTGTFSSLREINVFNCNKIKKLFVVKWLGYLQNLEIINVDDCEQMEEIIWSDHEGGKKVTLPKLVTVELTNLPQLKSIYSGSTTVLLCDSIKTIRIWSCNKIESVFWSGFNPLPTLEYLNLQELENLKSVFDEEALGLSAHLPPTIFFPLKTFDVDGCDQLKKVFSSGWLLSYFQFLEAIRVFYCSQIEELISSFAYEEEKVTLPNLQSLELTKLPQLRSICSSSNVLICDSMERLRIVDCEKLKRIPLNFGLLDNGQSSHPASLKQIVVFPKAWWESLEWDYPNAKDVLLPFCKFRDLEFQW